jgi:translocation and assembly module TamB
VALGLAVLLLLIGGVLSALATSSGSRWVIDQALEASQQAGSPAQAKLTGVSGSLLGRLELRGLTLADDQGVWLSADRLALEWRPWHLLKGRLWIEDISGGQIDVIRPPVTEPSSEEPVVAASSGGGFDPLLLERLTLRGLSVEALHLREGVVGPEASLSARAQMMGMALGGVGANAEIHRLDGATAITAEMTYNAQRRLALHAVIHDEQGGLLGTLSGRGGYSGRRSLAWAGGHDDAEGAGASVARSFAGYQLRRGGVFGRWVGGGLFLGCQPASRWGATGRDSEP